MSEQATANQANDEVIEFHVPKDIKRELNKLARAQLKSAAAMQERMFRIGELLAITKDEHFGGATIPFGDWLEANCPNIHVNYVAFYIALYKSEKEIREFLQDPAHRHKTSPQSIVRAYRKSLKPEPAPTPTDSAGDADGPSDSAGDAGSPQAGSGDTEGDDTAPGPVSHPDVPSSDSMSLDEALAQVASVTQLIVSFGNAVEFTDAQRGLCKDFEEIYGDLAKK